MDDTTSSSSCGAETSTVTTVKREAHTPTTDQSEDSGVDVSAAPASAAAPFRRARDDDDGDRGALYCKRKRPGDDGCPTAAKSCRTAASSAAVQLSVNVAVIPGGGTKKTTAATAVRGPPFRPWSCGERESSADVGLRLFHDIRNVDRILTLTRRSGGGGGGEEPAPEPQPLDLTAAGGSRRRPAAESLAVTPKLEFAEVEAATPAAASAAEDVSGGGAAEPGSTAAAAGSRYSKNMSRARRIEANARERSRVHTISAAFDTLRAAVPSYSRNQKLSKLSTIRIASAYILTLSRLLDLDYSAERNGPSVEECVNNVTGIIHMEGKTKKRRDGEPR